MTPIDRMRKALDALTTSGRNDWQTPDWLWDMVRRVIEAPWDPAPSGGTTGLNRPWRDNVYLNSPFGVSLPAWVAKAIKEGLLGNYMEIIQVTPGRIETKWFHRLLGFHTELCFPTRRVHYVHPDTGLETKQASFPTVIWYRGTSRKFREVFGEIGKVIQL